MRGRRYTKCCSTRLYHRHTNLWQVSDYTPNKTCPPVSEIISSILLLRLLFTTSLFPISYLKGTEKQTDENYYIYLSSELHRCWVKNITWTEYNKITLQLHELHENKWFEIQTSILTLIKLWVPVCLGLSHTGQVSAQNLSTINFLGWLMRLGSNACYNLTVW